MDDAIEEQRQKLHAAVNEANANYRTVAATKPLPNTEGRAALPVHQLQHLQEKIREAEAALKAFNEEHPPSSA